MEEQRGHWSSGLGFVLAATGSAVGRPIMMAEILIGRKMQKSPVGALRDADGPAWDVVGAWGCCAGSYSSATPPSSRDGRCSTSRHRHHVRRHLQRLGDGRRGRRIHDGDAVHLPPQLLYTEVPFGTLLGPLFYVLVALAALTSTISLLEVVADRSPPPTTSSPTGCSPPAASPSPAPQAGS